jgi:DNA-binding Lrp family transcriptional regulator
MVAPAFLPEVCLLSGHIYSFSWFFQTKIGKINNPLLQMFGIERRMRMESKRAEADDADRAILRELRKNCRRSFREIAASVGMSPAAVIERVRKLEGKGVVGGYSARIDYLKLGFEFMAITQIGISGDMIRVQERMGKLRGVAAVYDTTGKYDAVAILICRSRGELSSLVKKILGIPGVGKTNTNIVLNVVKRLDEFEGF